MLKKILAFAILLFLMLYFSNLFISFRLVDLLYDLGVTVTGHSTRINYFETWSPLIIVPLVFIKSKRLRNFSSVELLFVFLFFLISFLLGWVMSSAWLAIEALKSNSWLYVPDSYRGWNFGYCQWLFFIPFSFSILIIFGVRVVYNSSVHPR